MEGSELTKVSCEKDLGVWISDDMKCSKQCIYAFNKATKVLGTGMIKRTIRYKDTRVIMTLYKALVRHHVEHCVSAWNPHYIKDKKLIEKGSEEIYNKSSAVAEMGDRGHNSV